MKNLKQKHRSKLQKFKKCPMGGHCFNPLCMLGCVER